MKFVSVVHSGSRSGSGMVIACKSPNALTQNKLRREATRRWLWSLRMDGTVQLSAPLNSAQSNACWAKNSSHFSTPEVAGYPLSLKRAVQGGSYGL